MRNSSQDQEKRSAAYKAAEYIEDGMVLGLGTGSTSYYAIMRTAELVKSGLRIKAVATSDQTARIAREEGIEILDINDVNRIDLAIDGVDEIDLAFNAIKGGGGALFREKIIADMAEEVIWIMDSSKVVSALGAFPLPVEILTYSHKHILANLAKAGLKPSLRISDGQALVTDNGNYIADLHLTPPLDILMIRRKLEAIVGVLEDGFFLDMCSRIVIGQGSRVKVIENLNKIKE